MWFVVKRLHNWVAYHRQYCYKMEVGHYPALDHLGDDCDWMTKGEYHHLEEVQLELLLLQVVQHPPYCKPVMVGHCPNSQYIMVEHLVLGLIGL